MNQLRVVVIASLLFFGSLLQSQTNRPIGINLSKVTDWSPHWMFVDAMKQSRPWIVQNAAGIEWSVDSVAVSLRTDGYPTETPFVQGVDSFRVHTLLLDDQNIRYLYPAGTYTLLFSGTGEIKLEWDPGDLSFTVPDTPHEFTIDSPTDAGIHLIIAASDVNDPVHNIRVIMPGFAATYESQPFQPTFLERLQPFQSLRYMWPQGTIGADIVNWSDRTTTDTYTQSIESKGGIAVEYIVQLSNELDQDAWICIPHLANDDYVAQFAKLLHQGLKPDIKVYIEYSNETWNGIYAVAQHVIDKGVAMGLADDPFLAGIRYKTLRSLEIFEIFEDEFGVESDRLIKTIATWAGVVWAGEQIVQALADPVINPNSIAIDAIAIGPYFGIEIADDIARAGLVDVVTVDAILDSLSIRLQRNIPPIMDEYTALADSAGINLIAYEGGQHLVSVDFGDNTTLTEKLIAANRHPRMKGIYCDYYDLWYSDGGGMFATFDFLDPYGQFGSFGLLEHLNQDPTTSPKWMAHVECVFGKGVTTNVAEAPQRQLAFSLLPNYPNPFNLSTTIVYDLLEQARVKIDIFDILGRKVKTLIDEVEPAGSKITTWDGTNNVGDVVNSGVYFLKLTAGKFASTRKLILLK